MFAYGLIVEYTKKVSMVVMRDAWRQAGTRTDFWIGFCETLNSTELREAARESEVVTAIVGKQRIPGHILRDAGYAGQREAVRGSDAAPMTTANFSGTLNVPGRAHNPEQLHIINES